LHGLAMSRFPSVFYRGRSSEQRVFLDAISNALDDILYHRTMIALRLVVAVAHHAPTFTDRVPIYFDNAVVDLFAIGLHTFPLFVIDMHSVPGFISGLHAITPTPDVKCKDRLRVQIRLV